MRLGGNLRVLLICLGGNLRVLNLHLGGNLKDSISLRDNTFLKVNPRPNMCPRVNPSILTYPKVNLHISMRPRVNILTYLKVSNPSISMCPRVINPKASINRLQ